MPNLTMRGLDMQILKNEAGSNYKIILENLKRFESGEKEPRDPGAEQASKKMVIRVIDIQDVKVRMQLMPVGGELTSLPVVIDRIELRDVGSGGEPITAGDIVPIVIKAVLGAAMAKARDLPADFQGLIGNLQTDLGGLESLSEQGVTMMMEVDGQLRDVTQQIDTFVSDLAGGAGKAAEDVRKGLEDVGKGLGEMFEKKDESKKDEGGGGG